MMVHVLLCLLALWLALASGVQAAGLEDKLHERQAEARRIERQLAQKRRALERVEGKERSVADELKVLERELAARGRRLAKLERQRLACEGACARAKAEMSEVLPELGLLRDSLGERLELLSQLEPGSDCAALFGPDHPSRLAEYSLYLERLAEAEAAAIEARQAEAERLRCGQDRLERERRKLADLRARVAREQAAIESKQARKASLLASLARKKKTYALAAARLEDSSRAIRRLVDELEQKLLAAKKREPGAPPAQASTGFAALKGKLPLPVEGRVVSSFGQRDAYGIVSTGIDIEAPGGSPIGCVWRGRVAYAGMLKGYGNLVIVDHGDAYYTLYGRAARLLKSEGEFVERGDILGTVAEGVAALYFEIRHHRKPQDPLAWLAGAVAANARSE